MICNCWRFATDPVPGLRAVIRMNEGRRKLSSAARWVALVLSAAAISTYAGDTKPDSAAALATRSQDDSAPTTEPAGDHAVRHHRPTDEEWHEAEECSNPSVPNGWRRFKGSKMDRPSCGCARTSSIDT